MRSGDLVRLRKGEFWWKAHLLVGLEAGDGLSRYAVLVAPGGKLWRLGHYQLLQAYEVVSDVQD